MLAKLLLTGLVAAWTVENAQVAVSSGSSVDRVSVTSYSDPLELFDGRELDLAFTIPEEGTAVAHQVFLRLSVDGNDDAVNLDKIVLAKLDGTEGSVVVPYEAVDGELRNHMLAASLMVSGKGSEPVETKLFDVIALGNDDSARSTLRTRGYAPHLAGQPEIVHQFAAPPHYVNPLVAFVFIGAIDMLFLALVTTWTSNVSSTLSLPSSPAKLGLIGIVATIEVSFVLYFLSWSVFTLISVLAVLFPVLLVAFKQL